MTPLIIDNQDILTSTDAPFQSASPTLALQAVQSSAAAFPSWSRTPPSYRRSLLNKVAALLHERRDAFRADLEEEVHIPGLFTQVNIDEGAGLLEETAAVISEAVMGSIPVSHGESYAMVFKEALGVALGIAPWNAPVILGLRAVVAAVAAGNRRFLRAPNTHHYHLACLFRDAGFPPGVVNFILHRPEDAAEVFEVMINHPEVRKCNFTGSTTVGRIIASKAAWVLKPVLLELGGKNFALVLEDADIESTAEKIILGAMLNNGQICMSTDLVYVPNTITPALLPSLLTHLQTSTNHRLIAQSTKTRLDNLIADAISKGAKIHQAPITPPKVPSTTQQQSSKT